MTVVMAVNFDCVCCVWCMTVVVAVNFDCVVNGDGTGNGFGQFCVWRINVDGKAVGGF